jgi:hypothetical protein
MTTETSIAAQAAAPAQPEASPETKALNAAIDSEDGANTETGQPEKKEGEGDQPKKERTPEERERIRMQRKIDRLLQQRGELRAKLAGGARELTREPIERDNGGQQGDNETLSLSRQELQKLIDQEARKLAPTIKQQEAEIEHRRAVVTQLAKELGKEKFDALASDLDDAFDGLVDSNGRPKPAADAIFESEDPRALIEYLADPDHADEAEAIERMNALQAGRAIAKLEATLASKKAEAKPQPSKAAAPIEPIQGHGGGASTKRLADMSDAEFDKRRRQQIANRR